MNVGWAAVGFGFGVGAGYTVALLLFRELRRVQEENRRLVASHVNLMRELAETSYVRQVLENQIHGDSIGRMN